MLGRTAVGTETEEAATGAGPAAAGTHVVGAGGREAPNVTHAQTSPRIAMTSRTRARCRRRWCAWSTSREFGLKPSTLYGGNSAASASMDGNRCTKPICLRQVLQVEDGACASDTRLRSGSGW